MTVIPFDKITRFGQQTMLDRPLFNVSWILGRFCNYSCSYCWPYARSDQRDHQSLEVYKSTVDEIKRQARERGYTEFHWSFSGGEPTAYRELTDLIEHLDDGSSSPYQSIHMTTNLSPGSKWWKRWIEVTDSLQRRSITASFHAEHAKEQEFGDKILMLMSNGVFVTVNQVMIPERFDEYYERMSRLNSRGINVTLKPQTDPTASRIVDGYTPAMRELLRNGFPQRGNGEELYQIRLSDGNRDYFMDQAERFNAHDFNRFSEWTCNSGYQSVIIRGNEVKRAYSCHDQSLGTLADFRLFTTPQTCSTPTCMSSADSKIPKYK